MSDETKIFTKNDKNGDKCASGGQESGLKLIFERGVAILVRPWRFPGQPKKFVFFSIKVGTINSGTSLDSREQFKKTGKLEFSSNIQPKQNKSTKFESRDCCSKFTVVAKIQTRYNMVHHHLLFRSNASSAIRPSSCADVFFSI